jgi:serine/threonine protein kinase
MFKLFKRHHPSRSRPSAEVASNQPPTPTSSPSGPVPPAPDTFDYYDIKAVKEIGEGANGIIYKAQSNIGPVVLKLAKTYRIETEAAILNLAQHPNIIKQYSVITSIESSKKYMMMEYMDVGDLSSYLLKNTAPGAGRDPQRVGLAIDFLKGLVYLHSVNLVHRDIKCSNILLSSTASGLIAKLADFDSARKIDPEIGYYLSSINQPTGTPGYIDPDLYLLAQTGRITYTKESDCYSAGAVLLHLACDNKTDVYGRAMPRYLTKILNSNGTVPDIHPEVSDDDRKLLLFCFNTPRTERPTSDFILKEYAKIHKVKL